MPDYITNYPIGMKLKFQLGHSAYSLYYKSVPFHLLVMPCFTLEIKFLPDEWRAGVTSFSNRFLLHESTRSFCVNKLILGPTFNPIIVCLIWVGS